jgi:hypothetical protein
MNALREKVVSGWIFVRRSLSASETVEAKKPRRASARAWLQYTTDEYGLRETQSPEGAAKGRNTRQLAGECGHLRRNVVREICG